MAEVMDRDAWIESRILWKARKFRLPGKQTHLFGELPNELRAQLAAVTAERGAGKPVLAFVDCPKRWTLLATVKVLSLHGGETYECRLERLSDVGPRDYFTPGASLDEIKEWKQSWQYLRVHDDSGAVADLWVPCGGEAFALWNILRMFPGVCRLADR